MLRRSVSAAFALTFAGFITAAITPAHAEFQAAHMPASTFHDSAAAIINADGSLNNGTKVRKSWRVSTGRYCVQLDPSVAAPYSLIQLTPRDERRLPHIAYRNPSAACWWHHNTVAVNVYDTNTGRLANGGFDFLAL